VAESSSAALDGRSSFVVLSERGQRYLYSILKTVVVRRACKKESLVFIVTFTNRAIPFD
jgi:hypothetical protein